MGTKAMPLDKFFSDTRVACRFCGLTQQMPRTANEIKVGFYRVTCDHCGLEFQYVVRAIEDGEHQYASEKAIMIAQTQNNPLQAGGHRKRLGKGDFGERFVRQFRWQNDQMRAFASGIAETAHWCFVLGRMGHQEAWMSGVLLRLMANIIAKKQPKTRPVVFVGIMGLVEQQCTAIFEGEDSHAAEPEDPQESGTQDDSWDDDEWGGDEDFGEDYGGEGFGGGNVT